MKIWSIHIVDDIGSAFQHFCDCFRFENVVLVPKIPIKRPQISLILVPKIADFGVKMAIFGSFLVFLGFRKIEYITR